MSEKFSACLVDLDSLFDMRAAALVTLFKPEYFTKELEKGYTTRLLDEFTYLPADKFRELINNRDRSLLEQAVLTPVVQLLKDFINGTVLNYINSPSDLLPKIVLNVYPYELSEEDMVLINKALVGITEEKCDTEVISMSDEELTPKYIKNNFSMVIKYYHTQWLELHSKNELLKKTPCPDITLIAPALYYNRKLTVEEEKDYKLKGLNFFTEVEKMVAPVFQLKLVPVALFSVKV